MEEIKNLFIKYFGFYPDVVSTTEHSLISPNSRIISSLIKLSQFKSVKVLRLIMTDEFSIHPKSGAYNICIPHILNKNLFKINKNITKFELIKNFHDSLINMDNIIKEQAVLNLNEINNFNELIFLYNKAIEKTDDISFVSIYNNVLLEFVGILDLSDLYKWVKETNVFSIDSLNCKLFILESCLVLRKTHSKEFKLFGKYLEKNKRLKYKDINNNIFDVSFNKYIESLSNKNNFCSVPFELVLFIYSYCNGSHFGNDYNMIDDVKKINKNSNIVQLTSYNKDYDFDIQLNNIKFQKVDFLKNKWCLSNQIYKTVYTLPELYIILGKVKLKKEFINKIQITI